MLATSVRGSAISGMIRPAEPQLQFESPEVRVIKALEPLTYGQSPKLSVEMSEAVALRFNQKSDPAHVEYVEMVASLSSVLNRSELAHYLTVPVEKCLNSAREIDEGLGLKRMLWEMANRSEVPLAEGSERLKAVVSDTYPGLGLWGTVQYLADKVAPIRFAINVPQFESVGPIPARLKEL